MTTRTNIILDRHERKDRLGHGGSKAVAAEVGIHPSVVSRVVNGKQRHERVEQAIARRICRPGESAFPPREWKRRPPRTDANAA